MCRRTHRLTSSVCVCVVSFVPCIFFHCPRSDNMWRVDISQPETEHFHEGKCISEGFEERKRRLNVVRWQFGESGPRWCWRGSQAPGLVCLSMLCELTHLIDPSLFASIQEVEFRSLRGVAGGQAQSSLPSLAHPLLFQAVNEGDSPLFSTVTFWWLIFPPQTHKMFPWKVDMHEWNLS